MEQNGNYIDSESYLNLNKPRANAEKVNNNQPTSASIKNVNNVNDKKVVVGGGKGDDEGNERTDKTKTNEKSGDNQPTSASKKNENNVNDKNVVNGDENDDNKEIERIERIEKEDGCKLINYIEKDKIFYGCYKCIPRNKNKNEFICEYCYNHCHKECSINLKTYRIVDKPIIKFYCYCALHLNHNIVKSDNINSIYIQIGKFFYNKNEKEIETTNIKEMLRNLVDTINYYPFSPVENIRFTNSNFNIEEEDIFIKKYKDYFQNVLDNEYEIEKKNKYTNFPLFYYLYFCLNKILLKIKKLSLNDFIQNDISILKFYKNTYLKKN